MTRKKTKTKEMSLFERFAQGCVQYTGSTAAFLLAFLAIIIWIITGPMFHFSDTWQLLINTATTIITFLMVFLIQRAQNKDSRALHLKLNELIASLKGPSNRLIDVEDLTEDELKTLTKFYQVLSDMARREKDLSVSHSIEEAVERHNRKIDT